MRRLADIPLSVLDLAPVATGATVAEALTSTTELARQVEALGFHRMWVAEHHNMPGVASSAPPVLLAHLAASTSRLRLGSGGVMLPNHAPLVVAEQFGTLEALHPGRIDLGIGRAPGTDPRTAAALRRSPAGLAEEDFPRQLAELISFFDGRWPDGDPMAAVTAVPGRGQQPALWLLGSSGYSAQVAGMLGWPFAFAHHFSPANTLPALELYRSAFRASTTLPQPYAMVAVSVTCADTERRARELAQPAALSFLRLRSGHPTTLPTPAETADFRPSAEERRFLEDRLASQVIGSPERVAEELTALLGRTEADELMITTTTFDPADRRRSFDLVAELADLRLAGVASTGELR